MSGTTRFMRSLDATGRLKTGGLSGSEELERHKEGRKYRSWGVPEILRRPVSVIYNRLFQPFREVREVGRLQSGHYNILPPEARDLYAYPLDRAGAAISFCAYRYHPIRNAFAMHTGVDISTQHQNWPVLATAPGRVSQAFHEKDPRNSASEYGSFVIIKHSGIEYLLPLSAVAQEDHFTVADLLMEGLTKEEVAEKVRKSMHDNPTNKHYMRFSSLYGHLNEFSPEIEDWIKRRPERTLIEDGPRVDKGSYLGLSGTTGQSQSEHLHFEILSDVLMRPNDPSLPPYPIGESCVVNPGKLVVFR